MSFKYKKFALLLFGLGCVAWAADDLKIKGITTNEFNDKGEETWRMHASSTRVSGKNVVFLNLDLILFDKVKGDTSIKTPEGFFEQKKHLISGDKKVDIKGKSFDIKGKGFEIQQDKEVYIIHDPHVKWKAVPKKPSKPKADK